MRLSFVGLGVILLCTSISAHAVPVRVQETGADPSKIVNLQIGSPLNYSGGAYAGVINLLVDGVPMDGFCIDPFHFSNPFFVAADYNFVPLSNAPRAPGPMSVAAADEIEKLYAYVYGLPSNIGKPHGITAENAAGLQIAIWDVIADSVGRIFSLPGGQSDYGAATFRAIVEAPGYNGPRADLIALKTASYATGQDYLVRQIPDRGRTMIMLSCGFAALAFLRYRDRQMQPERHRRTTAFFVDC